MKRLYILLYSDDAGTREQMRDAVDACPLIYTWRYELPNSFFIVSESNATLIAMSLRGMRPAGQIIVAEVGPDYWGYSSSATWYLFANKEILSIPQLPLPPPPPPTGLGGLAALGDPPTLPKFTRKNPGESTS